jgi:hypothetical protein
MYVMICFEVYLPSIRRPWWTLRDRLKVLLRQLPLDDDDDEWNKHQSCRRRRRHLAAGNCNPMELLLHLYPKWGVVLIMFNDDVWPLLRRPASPFRQPIRRPMSMVDVEIVDPPNLSYRMTLLDPDDDNDNDTYKRVTTLVVRIVLQTVLVLKPPMPSLPRPIVWH